MSGVTGRWFGASLLILLLAPAGTLAASLYDPMRPPPQSAPPSATPAVEALPQLRALLHSPRGRLALFDGGPVAVGASVAGYQLERIDQNGVWLRREGRRWWLRLHPETVTRPSGRPIKEK
ncbi:hypothetical protein [Desulfuromonas thiophila]|uniref:MSHA biogenesis protein MshK n=1 Tax=Desulfuromonas thiophila TaxID=57664 RepID=A0A1G6ZK82_9BACT|nr:hypothetical protein [Desulfuromonas thiophila]SDE02911.1 hypothetical protein SAMN05661003_10319 [Desulfuromonas thiophila]